MSETITFTSPRELALYYVARLLARGYTVEDSKEEILMGQGGLGEPGYEISHGKITVPMCSKNIFSFAELAAELKCREEQPSLFEL